MPHEECRRGAHRPSLGREPVGGQTTGVCDARPVRRQTHGYLPSRFQIYCLLTETRVCKQRARGCQLKAQGRGSNPRPFSREFNALAITQPGHSVPLPLPLTFKRPPVYGECRCTGRAFRSSDTRQSSATLLAPSLAFSTCHIRRPL